jgi:hypothetical protein
MRLPAVAIAAAFACGILLGLHPAVARNAASFLVLSCSFAIVAVLIFTGMYFVKIERLILTAIASLLWAWRRFLGVCIAQQPRDPNHVISLVEQGRLPLKTPLRWHGQLRDEPTRLPWGYGYEISGVEFKGTLQPARGGLRVSFTAHPDGAPPPDLHAGDNVAVLAKAKLPQVFRDEGAFDRRAYLAQQNIDLVEREIVSENNSETMRADVLKVGHHGSKNSATTEFLAAVQPQFGIISAGEDNPYGHPSPELLDRLQNAGVRILRTDQNGAVHLVTDGLGLEISCFVECPGEANSAASVHAEAPNHQ